MRIGCSLARWKGLWLVLGPGQLPGTPLVCTTVVTPTLFGCFYDSLEKGHQVKTHNSAFGNPVMTVLQQSSRAATSIGWHKKEPSVSNGQAKQC